eukprot:c13138_g2_i1 orf=30-575(-)
MFTSHSAPSSSPHPLTHLHLKERLTLSNGRLVLHHVSPPLPATPQRQITPFCTTFLTKFCPIHLQKHHNWRQDLVGKLELLSSYCPDLQQTPNGLINTATPYLLPSSLIQPSSPPIPSASVHHPTPLPSPVLLATLYMTSFRGSLQHHFSPDTAFGHPPPGVHSSPPSPSRLLLILYSDPL